MEKRTSYAEFSSQLNDKNIVVFEFGRRYTRCGFAGETSPRAITKTAFTDPDGRSTYLHSLTDVEELHPKLRAFIEKLYFNHLAVSPREKKVVIVESVFCRSRFRNALTKIFFDQFNVPAILFVPDHLMSLATLCRPTGLIVDLGVHEAISIAVVDGVTLLDGAQFANLGANVIDTVIFDELIKNNVNADKLTSEVVEDIRVKACFVAPFERGLKIASDKFKKSKELQSQSSQILDRERAKESSFEAIGDCYFLADRDAGSPADIEYTVKGQNTVCIPGNLREGACEILFELFGHEQSLTTMIIETILTAPIDCRRSLAENILVIGGLANLPGLEHRLFNELHNIDKYDRFKRKMPETFKFHKPICPRNYVSWLGASIFCTPSSMELRATTREQWLQNGKKNLRDWSDLIR